MNWLLLRGLAREQRHWDGFAATLERVVPGSRGFCLDLAGAGTEFARTSPASVSGIVEELRTRWLPLRDANPGPWGLLGISLGGMVTMHWGGAFPGDFARLVIANTSAGNVSPPWRRMNLAVAPGVVRAMFQAIGPRRERNILSMTTNLARNNDARAERWARYLMERPISRTSVLRQLVAGSRFRAPRTLGAPLLVLSSGKDGFTDRTCPEKLALRFGAPLRVHPDANHDLGSDAPEWIAEQLRSWLAEPPALPPGKSPVTPFPAAGV